jgi:uncharacterized lipoprotein NlpE involved in copper resistance
MYKWTGRVLALLTLLMALMSTNFFLNMAKASVIEWLMFNACAPAIALFLLGYISRQKVLMCMSIPALLFFGGGGLFIFGWTGTAIISQVGHIFMVSAVIWMVYGVVKESDYKNAAIGLLLAAVFVNAFIAVQQSYAYKNWIRVQQVVNYQPGSETAYEGVLPGADCAGLKTELTLYKDNTYFLKETYLATRDGDKTYTSFGRWQKIRSGQRDFIQLNYDKPQETYNFLINSADHLQVVDKQLRLIPSPMNLSLTRKK